MGLRLIEGLAGARGRHRKDMDRFYASNSEKRLPNRFRQPLEFYFFNPSYCTNTSFVISLSSSSPLTSFNT